MKRVQITHRLPKLERPQHIAVDVNVACQIRIGELDLIEFVMARTAFLFLA